MTRLTRLIESMDTAAEALAALAMEYRALDGIEKPPDAPGAAQAPSFEELPFDDTQAWAEHAAEAAPKPAGSLTVCPAHNIAFLHGKNNTLFCPAKSDEPNWSNPRGYCTVTPKSAAAWLRQHA